VTFLPPLPGRDDPVWTAANGVVVPDGEGPVRLLGHERFTIKATAKETGGSLGLMEMTVGPGSGNAPHLHTHEDESFYVLDGELEFINGDQRFTARAGDFLYIPRDTRHGFANSSGAPARLLAIYTPGGFESFFLEHGQREGSAVPLDAAFYETITETMAAGGTYLLPGDHDWD
jgi:quercetin dioxygenase-like cupin family protein